MNRFAIALLLAAGLSLGVSRPSLALDYAALDDAVEAALTLPLAAAAEEPAESAEAASETTPADDAEKPAAEETADSENDEAKGAEETADPSEAKPDEKEKEAEKADAKPDTKKRKTHTVEPKRLKIDLTLDGTFVAREMEEVPLRPDAWTTFEIVEVVEHGAKVHKGETLIKFNDDKLQEAIADLELEQRLNELAIMRTEEELPRMEQTLKLDFEAAERASQQAREDFDRYKEIDRPMAVKAAEFMVRFYDSLLDYERDELEQLEKMYAADDLVEETEEIILKRQRNSVEFAEFRLENARQTRDETLNVRLPRADIRIKETLTRTALAQARAQMALSLDLNRARYELEQRKKARAKSLDRHAKLLADRELMEIKSPADGIVFYGQNTNGRWTEAPSLITKYKPKGNVSPGSVVMTVVTSRPLYVVATFDEARRPELTDGQKARVAPPGDGHDRVGAEVKSISPIPISPGKFEIRFELQQDEIPDWIVPGMSGKAQVTTYDKADALVVPRAAVRDDEENEDQKFVWVVDPENQDAKPERRDVKLGKRKGDEVEILEGLKKGDVVSLEDESEKAKKDS